MSWNRDLLKELEAFRLKSYGQMNMDLAWKDLDEIIRWHQEHRHIATEYPEGICKCEHRYCDGSCHVKCPECNPDWKTTECPLPKK